MATNDTTHYRSSRAHHLSDADRGAAADRRYASQHGSGTEGTHRTGRRSAAASRTAHSYTSDSAAPRTAPSRAEHRTTTSAARPPYEGEPEVESLAASQAPQRHYRSTRARLAAEEAELEEVRLRDIDARATSRRSSSARRRQLQMRRQIALIGAVVLIAVLALILIPGRGSKAGTDASAAANGPQPSPTGTQAVAAVSSSQEIAAKKANEEAQKKKEDNPNGYVWAAPANADDMGRIDPADVPENDPSKQEQGNKVIYLTFDDGPGPKTKELLDVLKKYKVKATFFVVGVDTQYFDDIARAAKEGHSIGVHSMTHDYSNIYASTDNFWSDFEQMQNVIKKYTGVRSRLMRFPGGSSNTISENYANGIMTQLTAQADEKGYAYADWTSAAGDAGETTDPAQVTKNIFSTVTGYDTSVVLCHDSKAYTVEAMKTFIPQALKEGYIFLPMSPYSYMAHHNVTN